MTRNPFHYGTPVEGDGFAGREDELSALTSRVRNGINVVVVSPRRYGKTSLLLRAEAELGDAALIHVNVLRCRSLESLASQLVTAAYRVPGGRWQRGRQAVPEFLRRVRASPTVSFDGDHPTFGFASRLAAADADQVISDVYQVLDELVGPRPAALVLDEFQAVVELGAHLPSLLKGLADSHPAVSLVLAGSKRHLMARLTAETDAALYGMAEHLALGPIPEPVMVEHLRRRAAEGRKPMTGAVAERIVSLAGPVPNDIQRLAYEAYEAAGRSVTEDDVEAGLAAAVAHEAANFADRFESLSPGQRRVIGALADDPSAQPYAAQFAARAGLANASSVRKAVSALVDAELVATRGDHLVVGDPYFAAWVRATR